VEIHKEILEKIGNICRFNKNKNDKDRGKQLLSNLLTHSNS